MLALVWLFFCVSEPPASQSSWDGDFGGEYRSVQALQLARDYLCTVRHWEHGSFYLGVRGRENEYTYICAAFKFEDRKKVQELHEKLRGGSRFGYYPSECFIVVDTQKKKVIKDIRPGQEDQRPRP